MEKQLIREVAKARASRERIEELVKQAREGSEPIGYARLTEITGWTREFLRRIVNGESSGKPHRMRPPKS